MKALFASLVLGVASVSFLAGCQSGQDADVRTTGRSQYTSTVADVRTTTDAARQVLMDRGLQNIQANATNVDGKVTGNKADGTDVKVWITPNKTHGSDVQVTVGVIGGPSLGADIAQAIHDRANASPATMRSNM